MKYLNTAIIYGLLNPANNNIFYVGKTETTLKKRLDFHIYEAKFNKKRFVLDFIRMILNQGNQPVIVQLEVVNKKNINDLNYFKRKTKAEKKWIRNLSKTGGGLTNIVHNPSYKEYFRKLCDSSEIRYKNKAIKDSLTQIQQNRQ